VTLAETLEAKERRATLISNFGTYRSVVSFTVVMPGPDKTGPRSRIIHAAGLVALRAGLAGADLAVTAESLQGDALGQQTIFGLDAPADVVKFLTLKLEEGHALGRLFDMDVFDGNRVRLSRVDFGLPERACLVCERPAGLCYREQAHSAAELSAAVDRLLARLQAPAFFPPNTCRTARPMFFQ
jgi:holo-ACP synthase